MATNETVTNEIIRCGQYYCSTARSNKCCRSCDRNERCDKSCLNSPNVCKFAKMPNDRDYDNYNTSNLHVI